MPNSNLNPKGNGVNFVKSTAFLPLDKANNAETVTFNWSENLYNKLLCEKYEEIRCISMLLINQNYCSAYI